MGLYKYRWYLEVSFDSTVVADVGQDFLPFLLVRPQSTLPRCSCVFLFLQRFHACTRMTVLQVSDDLEANLGLGGGGGEWRSPTTNTQSPPPTPPLQAQLSRNMLLLVTEEKWNTVSSDGAIPFTHTHTHRN